MGEIADMMLEGVLCATCGTYIGEGNGFPEYCCGACEPDDFGTARAKPLLPQVPQQLSKKLLQKLEWCKYKTTMYEGAHWEDAPAQFTKLERMGLVRCEQPHNPVHKARAVLTPEGRALLRVPHD